MISERAKKYALLLGALWLAAATAEAVESDHSGQPAPGVPTVM